MDDRLKRRLIGAAVLASLAVIFVPMLIEDEAPRDEGRPAGSIPPREDLTFRSQVLKDEIAVPTDAPPPPAGPEAGEAQGPASLPEPPVEPVAEAVAPPPPPAPPPKVAEPAPPPAEKAKTPPSEKPKTPPSEKPKTPPVEKPKTPPAEKAKTPPPAPKATPPVPKITTWIVQVGNYTSRDQADGVARQLRGRGLEVFVEPIGTPPVFRVAVGPESDRKGAEALIPRIQSAVPGGKAPFIRSYP